MTHADKSSATTTPDPARSRRVAVLVCAIPVLLVMAMLVTYLVAPDFYLQYILKEQGRERKGVEIVTVSSAFAASLILLVCAWRMWRIDPHAGTIRYLPGGALLVAVIGLASLFFAGEEVSWGQTWGFWGNPQFVQDNIGSTEFNLHNSELPVNSLGSLFLIVMFIGLPLLWPYRKPRGPLPLPHDWQPAIAEWPIVFCMVFAFVWKLGKDMFILAQGSQAAAELSTFYMDFVEQFNEQKEMLVAITLLLYALYRLKAVQRMARQANRSQ